MSSSNLAKLNDLQSLALYPGNDIAGYKTTFLNVETGTTDLRLVKEQLRQVAQLWNVSEGKLSTKRLRAKLLESTGAKAPKKATKVAKKPKVTNDSIRNSAPPLVDPKVNQRMDSLESQLAQLTAAVQLLVSKS